ncbi:hypothetical protein TTX_0261 [Thermoproteus tenax Kra 1]|uniref:Uncharacterized protein n=1 Tax=Thermoproteus tenax (strain ATCC 35583 / DSM 2078 / JCM 9277 / NBRC 100435 / Kra 1) TaxID=768679 RepID=G4RMZ3_THETK|nr:hypothetical protein TTX_0261 [Thermoproteus tenax Kra 1]
MIRMELGQWRRPLEASADEAAQRRAGPQKLKTHIAVEP